MSKVSKASGGPEARRLRPFKKPVFETLPASPDPARYLKNVEPDSNIIFINLQELEFDSLHDYHTLHQYVLDKYNPNKENILIIEEV